MEVDRRGDETAPSPRTLCGKKRPPSPSTPPGAGEDSPISDEDDNPWAVSEDEEEDEDEYKGKYRPFTVDDFPRVSTDEQQDALYSDPEISLRGPKILWRSPAFKPEIGRHPCETLYQLSDDSES